MGSLAHDMKFGALRQSQVHQYRQPDATFVCQDAQECWALSPLLSQLLRPVKRGQTWIEFVLAHINNVRVDHKGWNLLEVHQIQGGLGAGGT